MIAEFGFGSLVISFALTFFAIGAALYGYYSKSAHWVESSRRAQQMTFPIMTLSTISLIFLLVTGHYEVEYVYSVTDNVMPFYLKVTALWGGQAGSLLFWSWLLSAFATAVTLRKWGNDRDFLPWVVIVTSVTLAFFLTLIIFFENPFARWWLTIGGDYTTSMFPPKDSILAIPGNGRGLNPLLRHPGMIFHPPLLYLGFVSFVIPYAFAIATLVTGRTDDRWIQLVRGWALAAWLFLSLGLVLGMRWAYDVLGWGGYWGWDPVEIAALMPWLTGTPFLHSVMIEEKKGIFRSWNLFLIILTYCLVLFGTFLTRSGILSSVHAFSQSTIGPMFFIFIGITFFSSAALLINQKPGSSSAVYMKSFFSREALFLLNNLLFMGVLIVCFWGVIFPLISELVMGVKVTVGPPFYERASSPLLGALVGLMGIAPLSAWGRSAIRAMGRAILVPAMLSVMVLAVLLITGIYNWVALIGFPLLTFTFFITIVEYIRGIILRMNGLHENALTALVRLTRNNRRRYGGYIIHLAMIVMAIGILGIELFQKTTQKNLSTGEEICISDYCVRFDALSQFEHSDRRYITRAVVSVYKDGKFIEELYPRFDIYPSGQPVTIAGIHSTLFEDLYIVLVNWEESTAAGSSFKVYINPLISWLWIGSFIFIIGYFVAAWPAHPKK